LALLFYIPEVAMKRHFFALVVAVLFVVLPAKDVIRASASTSSYTVEDLGTIGGLVPTITGMNASGQVTGFTRTGSGLTMVRRAVRYTNDIGWEFIPGVHLTNSVATAINASGDVAGYHLVGTTLQPFRYVDGPGATSLGPVPGWSFALGLSINAAGVMTGHGETSLGIRGWRAEPGLPLEELPTLGGAVAMTCGINDKGQIAGLSTNALGQQHAYRVDPRSDGTGFDVTDIVPLDGAAGLGRACAINAAGRVGGNSSDGSAIRAFVSDGGPSVNVDTFGSVQSTVESMSGSFSVGWFIGALGPRAFVHTNADGSADLNDLLTPGTGWILQQAFAVNKVGQIAGIGTLNGVRRAFRLTPTTPPPDETAPVISAVSATPSTVSPPKGQLVDVTVAVTATDDVDAMPVCTVSSISATGGTTDDYSFTGLAASVRAVGGRTYTLNVTCADAAGNVSLPSSTDVVVPPDTTAPVISAVSATPSTVSPPKGQLVDVAVAVTATDDVDDAPVCAVSSISATGGTADDYSFTGLTARIRAVGGRTYTLNVTCADAVGNVSPASSTDVVVPPDTTAPVISAVSATPSIVGPPKGQLVDITVAVTATDDVDDAPVCAVSSITATGSTADDYSFAGLAARVLAVGGRTYTLSVTCADAVGNVSPASSTNVVVPPDTTAPVISAVSATPSTVGPPKGQLVDVAVAVTATDDVDDAPVCAVSSISATGSTADDYSFTGLAARVRAVGGRTYTLNVTCADVAGNVSPASSTNVVVPPDTTAPVISAVSATPSTVGPPKGQLVDVAVAATATDDVDDAPVCAVSSISATGSTADDYSFAGLAARVRAVGGRTYTLNVTCADAAGNVSPASSTTVVVPPDTTAPVISALAATPSTVSPTNGQLVDVAVLVIATDDVDAAPVCTLSSITASGTTTDDFTFTGLSARVRAVAGRTYTLNVTCADAAGNVSPSSSTNVVVLPDTTAPVIGSLHATPDAVWPPNGKMVAVSVAVSATDNVDSAPQCSLTSITANGGGAVDWAVTGQFTADVRAEKNSDGSVRIYSLHVTCTDRANNASSSAAIVVVGKDPTEIKAFQSRRPKR
jgi:predicted thioesterase